MLKKELSTILTDTLGIDQDALKEALTSDNEVEVSFKSGTFMDDEALGQLKNTVKKEGYNEGKITGVEMEAKRIKEKLNIDVEGKSFDNIFDAYSKQVLTKAKIEPDKKVKELSQSLENLQKQYNDDLGLKDTEITNLNEKLNNFTKNSELRKHIPGKLKGIKQDQFMTLAKASFGFDFEDSKFVAKQNGSIMKDKLEQPVPVSDVLTQFAAENNWLNTDGRAGNDDLGGGNSKFKTITDLFKHMKENNIDPYGQEGQKLQDDFNNK